MEQLNKLFFNQNPFFRHCQADRKLVKGLSPDTNQQISLNGLCNEALNFISREQLCDRGLWAKFVEQYRIKSDTPKQEWRSEYWGKMMRGAAFVYSVSKDERLYSVLEETVLDLLTVQDADGAFTTYQSEVQFTKWDLWGRKYILLGLLCFHAVCRDANLCDRIVSAAKRHADAILKRVGYDTADKMQIEQTSITADGHPVHGAMNSLSILEPMVLLYRLTKEPRYLDFAAYLVEYGARACGNIFELAYANQLAPYQYPYTKAYEMMSCFEGLLEYALTTGNEKWKTAVIHFAYRMIESEITLLGSAGTTHEFLDHASVHQTDQNDVGVGQETCVSVTWMKFCSRMLILTGDPLFGDCFEQTLYNAYLGAFNYDHVCNPERIGRSFLIPAIETIPSFLPFDSYTPLLGGSRGQGIGGSLLFPDGTYYGCCACIGSVGIGIAPHLAVMRSKDGFSIQLYEKGIYRTKTPDGKPVTFSIDTGYPAEDTIRIQVNAAISERFTLSLRIPCWSMENHLLVNGESYPVATGMTSVTRLWQAGDTVELRLDMRVEALRPTPFGKDILRSKILWKTCDMVPFAVEEDEGHQNYVAFRRGPLILSLDERLNNPKKENLELTITDDDYLPAQTESVLALPFRVSCYVSVSLDEKTQFRFIDSASAGRTWNPDSAFSVWIQSYWLDKKHNSPCDVSSW